MAPPARAASSSARVPPSSMSPRCPAVDVPAKVRLDVSRRHALGLLAVLAVSACKEPPSFRVRWHLVDREGAEVDVTRAIDCTELGINAVQITSIDGAGEVADARIYPCFTPRFE